MINESGLENLAGAVKGLINSLPDSELELMASSIGNTNANAIRHWRDKVKEEYKLLDKGLSQVRDDVKAAGPTIPPRSRASIRCHKCQTWVKVEDEHPCFGTEVVDD